MPIETQPEVISQKPIKPRAPEEGQQGDGSGTRTAAGHDKLWTPPTAARRVSDRGYSSLSADISEIAGPNHKNAGH